MQLVYEYVQVSLFLPNGSGIGNLQLADIITGPEAMYIDVLCLNCKVNKMGSVYFTYII